MRQIIICDIFKPIPLFLGFYVPVPLTCCFPSTHLTFLMPRWLDRETLLRLRKLHIATYRDGRKYLTSRRILPILRLAFLFIGISYEN